MTNKKKSSIEWLYEELNKPFQKGRHITEIFQQAKEMHRQEIVDAYDGHPLHARNSQNGEEYYFVTFEQT